MKRSKQRRDESYDKASGPEDRDGDWRARDPNATAEAARYAQPLPSRQLIQRTIADWMMADGAEPPTVDDLIAGFDLKKLSEQEGFAKRLVAMVRDGQLRQDFRGGYCVEAEAGPRAPDSRLVEGRVIAHRDGYGFLNVGAGAADVFLPPRQMRGLMDGDRARVRVTAEDQQGRREGVLVQIVERGRQTLVGRLHHQSGVYTVIPSAPKLPEVIVQPGDLGTAKAGQVVVVELTTPPNDRALPLGRVVEIVGDYLAPGMEIQAAIRAHNLPNEWPPEVEREAAAYGSSVTAAQIAGREDLRKLGLMTIDGADARDFDDAVYAERVRSLRGGWKLWVAIADVSAYVKPGSALDAEAADRGNSVYFPDNVIPMLPEALSNGLCSLNPQVDRLCMVCELRVDRNGELLKSRFYEAVMRSQARLIYEDVAAMLAEPEGELASRQPQLIKPLQTLKDVFEALFKARAKRGAIDFEGGETKIVFGADRKIERIVPVQRTIAHRLIEECMIAANVEAAKLVDKHKMPAPYRVHAEPDADKITVLREFLNGRGVRLGGGAVPAASDFAAALNSIKGREDAGHIQNVMLRSLMQARYSADNSGHFGLALTHYAHFTSPIRRYPDLLLHRAIKHVLARGKVKDFDYTAEQIEQLGAHCSTTERRADEATREVMTFLKCEYMRHRVGQELDGIVTSVAPFGLFVELDGLYVDGLVHVSTLEGDFFQFDARHQRLVGERSKRVHALGDRVHVKVARVSLDERKIDLLLLNQPPAAADGKPRRRPERQAHSQDKRSHKPGGKTPPAAERGKSQKRKKR